MATSGFSMAVGSLLKMELENTVNASKFSPYMYV
jgi:hypothetical protein